MGLAAVGLVGGQSIILGLESVSMARTDIHGMQTSVANFTSRVDRHPFAASATIIPVIEANASEVPLSLPAALHLLPLTLPPR